VKSGNALEGEL